VIRVAVADDSPFTCRLLQSYLESDGECEVVGLAHDAAATRELVRRERPDVLTLDLEMPGGRGLDLLNDIVTRTPVPVIVISGVTRRAAATTLRALELGAVDFVLKYTPGAPVSPATLRREIVEKVKTAATATPASAFGLPAAALRPLPRDPSPAADVATARVIVIGASTGGPQAVRELIAQLPSDFTTPCVIVQHLPPSFAGAFAAQLARCAQLPVDVAEGTNRLTPGRLLLTPGGRHLFVRPGGRFELRPAADTDIHRPSIDFTMISAAESCSGGAIGVVLSGMGCDGAEGLRRIRAGRGLGYVQDPATCVVGSMPSRAIERAGADCVAAPARIGALLAARRAS
jgi:two-component system, chemotaxis family, protein-glutamate methylesterase/glutaminase